MPRPRFATADAALQRRILDVATQEFTAKGYEAASLNRILLAAGLSKGSFYYYFDDKADLAAAVLAELVEHLRPAVDELGKPKDAKEFWAALRRFTDRTMDESFSTRGQLELIGKLGMAFVDHPELAAQVMPRIAGYRDDMIAFMKRGQKVGAIRSDFSAEVLMSLMQATKTALAAETLPRRTPTRAELEKFNDVLWELLLRMVKP
jgi:AcrR family transcriptional regulator